MTDLLDYVTPTYTIYAMVFVRVASAMFLLPVLGESSIPLRLKLAAAIALTVAVAPAIPLIAEDTAPVALIFIEALIGLGLGLSLRLVVMALQIAGSMAAQAASLSHLIGGVGPEPQPAISQALLISGLTLAVILGLHVKVVLWLIGSYEVLPMGQPFDAATGLHWMVVSVTEIFALAFSLAMPFLAVSLIYNIALGVINRAMPQMMVAFVGAPVITLGALALLALLSPVLLVVWSRSLDAALALQAFE